MQLRRWLVVAFLISACGEEVKRPDRLAAEACAREALVLTSEEANTYWVRQRFDSDLPASRQGRPCEVGDPDEPALVEAKSDVLRSVLKDPAFRVIEARWSVCIKTAGYAWEDFDDPLSASSNVGTLIADFGALRSAMVAGIETPELRAAYETSVAVAERWAVPAVLVDRSCRAPYSKELEVLIQKSKVD